MKTPASLRIRYRVQPSGLWPDGGVTDQWMNPARTHCFVLLDTGWVLSIDARSGATACAELLDVPRGSDRVVHGVFFGEERCRLFVITARRECFFFALEPGSPPRLAQRAPVATDTMCSIQSSLDQSRLVVLSAEQAQVFVASTFELDDVDAYPAEIREWSGVRVRGHEREVVRCDDNGVRVFSEDRAPWQCVRFEIDGYAEFTRASATAVLAVQRRGGRIVRAAWHVDLAKRTAHDLRAMGVSHVERALSCGSMLALSRDHERLALVDLDRGAIIATLQVGPHALVSMDVDCVIVLRNGVLSRVDLGDRSVTDIGERTSEEAAPIASIFVTDRAELVTVNAAGRRCAYDSAGALVAESNEPLSFGESVLFVGSSDGDTVVFEQRSLGSRPTVITRRPLSGPDLLQPVARLVLSPGDEVHGCTTQGRVLFSYHSSAEWLSLSSTDLSLSERLIGAAGRGRAWGLGPTDERARLQCAVPERYDGDRNPMGPPPAEFLLYIAQSDSGATRVSEPFLLPGALDAAGPFEVFEGAFGERFLRASLVLWSRPVFARALTRDESLGCVLTDQDELVFYSAEERREALISCAGWLAPGERVMEVCFSAQAKHLALSTSLGRIVVATLEDAPIEPGSRDC